MTDLPQWFNGGFDLTVQHLTEIFEDFTEARDVWRSAHTAWQLSGATTIPIGRRSGLRHQRLRTQRSWALRPGRRRSIWWLLERS